MKLDKATIKVILDCVQGLSLSDYRDCYKVLEDLELYFKPGDSSQSVLVDGETLKKDWLTIYDKRK